ncbi:uncharacterized protein G2W53_022559 [Senna tora]|uniref:Uncharacterized protein n=1 Tax=Senna tora TaxID=362788 RepID=A0A834TM75_9FABA|nr:uncharacterized protein G2W53_022559 [Senna tora]
MAIQLERQREVNLTYGGSSVSAGNDNAEVAMLVKGGRNEGGRRRETKEEKYAKYCEHCHMNGHLKETCFKLQGYPEWYKDLKKKPTKKSVNLAASIADSPLEELSTEKMEGNQTSVLSMLVKELSKVMKAGASESVNFAQLGNFAELASKVLEIIPLATNLKHRSLWITHHETFVATSKLSSLWVTRCETFATKTVIS